MRSSESANSASKAISVKIRYLPGNSQIVEKAAAQNRISIGSQCARAARARDTIELVSFAFIGLPARRAREQSLRAPDQDHDHDRVNDEGAERWHIIFAGDVADTEQECRKKRPRDARGAAHGHDDQKVDHEFEREARIEPEDFRAERAAEAREP